MASCNPNQNKDFSGDLLNNMRPFVPRYGGQILSPEGYDVLFDIVYKYFNFEKGLKTVSVEKQAMKSVGISTEALEKDCLSVISKFDKTKDFSAYDKRSFFEMMKEIANKISNFGRNAVEEYQPDFSISYGEPETLEEITRGVFPEILKAFLYKLDYVVPREEITTNISGLISTITPNPEKPQEVFEDEETSFSDEEYQSFCTSLSPFLLRAIICELDNFRVLFFDQVKTSFTATKEELISTLTNYEDSGLSYEAILDEILITQEDYDVVIAWDNPALITAEFIEYKEDYEKAVQPIKKLLNELGGDLKVSLDKFELRVVISCPKQEEVDFCDDLRPDYVTFDFIQGEKLVEPDTTLVRVNIPCRDNSVELTMCKIFLSEKENRKKLAQLLSYLDKLNKNNSLTKVSVYSKNADNGINITLKYGDSGTIMLTVDGNIDEKTVPLITSIAELSNNSSIKIARTDPSTLNMLLEGLISVVKKVEAIDSGKKFFKLEKNKNGSFGLEVCDSKKYVIVNAVYKDGNFCGRCHDPELTNVVLDVCFDIIDSEQFADSYSGGQDPRWVLVQGLERYGFCVTDRFVKFLANVYKNNIDSEDALIDQIDSGMVIIKNGRYGILIDAPAEDSGEKMDAFLQEHKL